MQEKLRERHLTIVAIPASEVKWVEYKKEISINNRLFDVESYSLINDQYLFKGLFDDEETILNENFEKDYDNANENESQLLSKIFQLLQGIYFNDPNDQFVLPGKQNNYNNLALLNMTSPFINILTPPPQI